MQEIAAVDLRGRGATWKSGEKNLKFEISKGSDEIFVRAVQSEKAFTAETERAQRMGPAKLTGQS